MINITLHNVHVQYKLCVISIVYDVPVYFCAYSESLIKDTPYEGHKTVEQFVNYSIIIIGLINNG